MRIDIVNYYKILCGIIALGISIINWVNKKPIIGSYWLAVTCYWLVNFVGG